MFFQQKLKNMTTKQSISEKKRSHLLKRHLYQNGKAENMLMVVGRLVTIAVKQI